MYQTRILINNRAHPVSTAASQDGHESTEDFMVEFSGPGSPLSRGNVADILSSFGLQFPELWSVLSVETSGCGYLSDRRPKILFERHVFSRLTSHRYDADDPDISQPTAGGYGAPGANQYDRLNAAMQLDRAAALQSASWGLGQIMGENFAAAGFDDAEKMVAAMTLSEDNQLRAMVSFMKKMQLIGSLQAHDWTGFARRYNGPNYAANNYDGLLEHFYERYSQGPLPDLATRRAQILLTYEGFNPGAIDGVCGATTRGAIFAFQKKTGLEQTGVVDDALLEALGSS
jgi:N-acetylmuramidase/Putative peptidoglycan binding domain